MNANLFIAFIGALGLMISLSAFSPMLRKLLGIFGRKRLDLAATDEVDPNYRVLKEDEMQLFAGQPILERLLGGSIKKGARNLAQLGAPSPEAARERADRIARDLRKSGFRYPTVGDYYAQKLLGAILFFFLGLAGVVLLDMDKLFFLPFILGLFGLFMPDMELRNALKKRKQYLVTEMAFVLDRLALMLQTVTLEAAITQLTRTPGGLFTAEMRKFAAESAASTPTSDAVQNLLDRVPDCHELTKFTNLMLLSIVGNRSITRQLRLQADSMRSNLENEMLSRGLNSTMAVTGMTAAFALPSLAIIILVPVMAMAWNII